MQFSSITAINACVEQLVLLLMKLNGFPAAIGQEVANLVQG